MKRLLAVILLFAFAALAKDKPQYTYQDGVLESFKRVVSGDKYEMDYTVKSGGITYILTPIHRVKGGPGTLTGFIGQFQKGDILADQLPGTSLKLRP